MAWVVLIWFTALSLPAANWYVDSAATGANDGTSWADAWPDPSDVVWGGQGVKAGDTLYISGGNTEKVYTNTWAVGVAGTQENRITIRVGQDPGHNGCVIFDGASEEESFEATRFTSLNRDYITVDGSVNGAARMIFRNIVNTNNPAYTAFALDGGTVAGVVVRHIIFTNVGNGIRLGMTANSAIHNCAFYVRGDTAIKDTAHETDWDRALIYSNTITMWIRPSGGGPDGLQIASGLSIFNNRFRCQRVPFNTSGQHPDYIQGIDSRWIKFYGNECVNIGDSGFDLGPFYGTNGLQDIRIYNNIWRMEEQIDPYPEYIRFSSAYKDPMAFFRNIYIVNNLFVDNTNANTQIVRAYPEFADAGVTGTNNWIANNIWVGCSRNEYNPMFKTFNTNNPSVWTITNNIYNPMPGSPGYVVWENTNLTVAQWIDQFDPSGTTNLPAFQNYVPHGTDNNFRLLPWDTVAAGKGLDFSELFTTDFDGNLRSGAWDIGPFQLSSATPSTPPTTPSTPPTTPSTPPTTPSTPPTTPSTPPATFPSIGATRYVVSLSGNDSNAGTADEPFRTIGKAASVATAGDTIFILPGDYAEHVHVTASGTAGNPIVFRSFLPHRAEVRAFRIGGSHVVVDGLKFTKFSGVGNTWNTATRIEPDAHFTTITNCLYTGLPYVMAADFRFDAASNQVISESSDFGAAGFGPGSKVYLGACGLPGMWYTNHDTLWIVASNTPTSLWLTNAAGTAFGADPGSNYWAVVRAGHDTHGFRAIDTVISGGVAATNLLLTGNTISNWMASALMIRSPNTTIENNTFAALKGFRFLDFGSDNLMVRSNWVKDCPNTLYFSDSEYGQLPHEGGGTWFDYQLAMFADGTMRTQQTNIVFAYNWFENLDNQLGGIGDTGADCYDITFHNNVFVGITMHFSGGRDGMHWVSNTFYRCSYETPAVLATGSSPPAQTNYIITKNLFIDCGPKGTSSKGWYTVTDNALDPVMDYNMVAGPEMTGYEAKDGFTETHGINGGDPLFLNAANPLGPDGLPFTADDGLQVLPNSPAAALGGGACGVYTPPANQPVAHFRVSSPQGWFEPTGDNYDPAWLAKTPWERTAPVRPYTTPETLGEAPMQVTFDASDSLPGSGETIVEYQWTVDGQTVITNEPTFTHTFTSGGLKPVQLTVVNGPGNNMHSIFNLYRVRGSTPARPMTPQNLRLMTIDMANVSDQYTNETNSVPETDLHPSVEMVLIPGGTFLMGNTNDASQWADPIFSATVSPFFMKAHETTVAELAAVMQWAVDHGFAVVNGNYVQDQKGTNLMALQQWDSEINFVTNRFVFRPGRDHFPAHYVSWFGAVSYCNWASLMQGLEPCYDLETWECDLQKRGYRLPTEAEWERAARGGHEQKRFPWAHKEIITHADANHRSDTNNWYDVSPTRGYHPDYAGARPGSSPVGTFAPNNFGLYDMSGNVWEWTGDWWEKYDKSPKTNPTGPATGTFKVFRGGSWRTTAERTTCAVRYISMRPHETINDVGFRVVISYRP